MKGKIIKPRKSDRGQKMEIVTPAFLKNTEGDDWVPKLFMYGTDNGPFATIDDKFWHDFSLDCLRGLCQAASPANNRDVELAAIGEMRDAGISDEIAIKLETECESRYRRVFVEQIWQKLLDWCWGEVFRWECIKGFIGHYAPKWVNVGKIFFHLAENKLDPAHPFAFMATYSTEVNEKGELRYQPIAQALQKCAANPKQVGRILGLVHQAAAQIGWVGTMAESGAIYQPQPWTPREAYAFLASTEKLEALGIFPLVPDWWKKRPKVRVKAEIGTRDKSLLGADALLKFNIGLAMGEDELSKAEIGQIMQSSDESLLLLKNQWVLVDKDKLRQALTHWQKLEAAAEAGELNFIQGMRMLAGWSMEDYGETEEEEEIAKEWSFLQAGSGFREILDAARAKSRLLKIPGLQGRLRPYQQKGVAWLRFLTSLGLGACLADDMGLGKTIQVLSLLLLEKGKRDMPALLVAPASVMDNWKAEAASFAPDLNVLMLHPAECKNVNDFEKAEALKPYDLVITSYAMTTRLKWLAEHEWGAVIADEAQNIKNAQTKQSLAVRALKSGARIALTGTPIENSLNDLWSIFDFINPGLLGSASEFSEFMKKINKTKEGLEPLRKLTSPYILRRMKTDKKVIDTLPDKTEMKLSCNLSREQAKLYQKVTEDLQLGLEKLKETGENPQKRNMLVLQSLMLLKQVCNHPAQAGATGKGYIPARSGKFLRMGELCETIAENGEKVLIFTQFREIIPGLVKYLEKIFKRPGLALHGGTRLKKRAEMVQEFQKVDGPPFFVLSLKAGGSGLNLTEASHVIHFDRWWNPAVEDQATDRSYRIGQKRNVLVHKCITMGTLEEKIDELIESKRDLAAQALEGSDSAITEMSDEQIMDLVKLDARAVME